MMSAWEEKEYRLESLIYVVAHSLPFQSRREELVQEENDPKQSAGTDPAPAKVPENVAE